MIQRLKIKFILLSTASLAVLLALVAGGMNALNYMALTSEADEILAAISMNHGAYPAEEPPFTGRRASPEVPYETRYFSVLLAQGGEVIETRTDSIISVDPSSAAAMAAEALASGERSGFIGDFRYLAQTEEDSLVRVSFLDCGRRLLLLDNFRNFSIETSLAGLLVMVLVLVIFSRRFVRPVAESYERQKQFVADAGHELKTPLTVIGANADVLEMDVGKNESIDDIREQVRHMAKMTEELVELARMGEAAGKTELAPTDITAAVKKGIEPWRLIAGESGKRIGARIEEGVTGMADARSVGRLTGILLDNAVKYSPEGAVIEVVLERRAGRPVLTVLNPSSQPVDRSALGRVFERFYRMDASRNSEIGGTGLGLAMAEAICKALKGRIKATTDGKDRFIIEAEFSKTGQTERMGPLLRRPVSRSRGEQGKA